MADAPLCGPDPCSPSRHRAPGDAGPEPSSPAGHEALSPKQELLRLRQELEDFSTSLRSQLLSHEERQERLLARLERAQAVPEKRPWVVSLDAEEKEEPQVVCVVAEELEEEPAGRRSTRRAFSWLAWPRKQEAPKLEEPAALRIETVRTELGEAGWRLLGRWIDWWVELQEPPKDGRLAQLVRSRAFGALCTLVVLVNSVVIVYTTNYEAQHLAEQTTETWRIVNAAFAAFYCLELVLRLSVHGLFFFCNEDGSWNLFEAGLVALAAVDVIFSELTAGKPVSVTHMRTVRAVRVLRATKVLRMFRLMRFFANLRLLLSSMLNSLVSLLWGVVMLAFMIFIFALIFVQGATLARLDGLTEAEARSLQASLGSTQIGMLTLLQASTGGEDWATFYRLIQLTGDWNCGLFLFFIAFVQLALLNILTGIFVEHAMKLAQPDRDIAALQQRKEDLDEAEELRSLIRSMDTSGRGVITKEQFVSQLRSEQFRARLALLGLEIKHAELFFESVCTDFGSQEVAVEAFVAGAMRLKGNATSLDLQTLTFGTKLIHENQLRLEAQLDALAKQISD